MAFCAEFADKQLAQCDEPYGCDNVRPKLESECLGAWAQSAEKPTIAKRKAAPPHATVASKPTSAETPPEQEEDSPPGPGMTWASGLREQDRSALEAVFQGRFECLHVASTTQLVDAGSAASCGAIFAKACRRAATEQAASAKATGKAKPVGPFLDGLAGASLWMIGRSSAADKYRNELWLPVAECAASVAAPSKYVAALSEKAADWAARDQHEWIARCVELCTLPPEAITKLTAAGGDKGFAKSLDMQLDGVAAWDENATSEKVVDAHLATLQAVTGWLDEHPALIGVYGAAVRKRAESLLGLLKKVAGPHWRQRVERAVNDAELDMRQADKAKSSAKAIALSDDAKTSLGEARRILGSVKRRILDDPEELDVRLASAEAAHAKQREVFDAVAARLAKIDAVNLSICQSLDATGKIKERQKKLDAVDAKTGTKDPKAHAELKGLLEAEERRRAPMREQLQQMGAKFDATKCPATSD